MIDPETVALDRELAATDQEIADLTTARALGDPAEAQAILDRAISSRLARERAKHERPAKVTTAAENWRLIAESLHRIETKLDQLIEGQQS